MFIRISVGVLLVCISEHIKHLYGECTLAAFIDTVCVNEWLNYSLSKQKYQSKLHTT